MIFFGPKNFSGQSIFCVDKRFWREKMFWTLKNFWAKKFSAKKLSMDDGLDDLGSFVGPTCQVKQLYTDCEGVCENHL